MTPPLPSRLDRALVALQRHYPGPGGAVAVVRGGEVLVRHAWGFANAERRIPFTPGTLFRMCSVTKQFTCALMLDLCRDPSVLDAAVRARLPRLAGEAPSALHLAHNQSGLRDYWAVAMLQGAPAESAFGDEEAAALIGSTRSLQFAPGTRYAYCNQNFRILSDVLAERAGASFADLLRDRLFRRIGMDSAVLAADTGAMPDGTEGYEGSQGSGFRPAVNRILWTGDAGLGASLDDMVAWERHIDATRDDPASLYRGLSAPVAFAGGEPAAYGFGLGRSTEFGHAATGHGGALRGWRSHRLHIAGERLSIVVLFNHLSDARGAALDLLAAVLDAERPTPDPALPAPDWVGAYLEPETGLSARIEPAGGGQVTLRFGHTAERLDLLPDGTAGRGGTRLRGAGPDLWMDRPGDNMTSRLVPCAAPGAVDDPDLAGRYRCAEIEADLTVVDAGGVLYGGFSGPLGRGRMELLEPVGRDVMTLPCWRALDHTPPGDWTLAFRRESAGRPDGVTVGCWLARGLHFVRAA